MFLDEIGELSLAVQVKLLRVIQEREFSRLGSNRLIPLKARLIFATNQDLGEMVAQGKFRQDLYYRINVMRIEAPALQDHRQDLPQIANHFLRHYSEMYQKPMECFDSEAMALLESYSWPGNVRELENVIQRAIILARSSRIMAEDLPAHIQEEGIVSIDDYQPAGSFERQLREYKLKLAIAAVREHNGNKTLAARVFQISRAYLHRLIRGAGPELVVEPEHGQSWEWRELATSRVSDRIASPEGYRVLRKLFSFPVMVASLLVVLAVTTVRSRFDDPDMWLHLKMGQVIWTTHVIPTTDLFLVHDRIITPLFRTSGFRKVAHLWRVSMGEATSWA